MTGIFLDTTVLIHVSEPGNTGALKAEALVAAHRPTEVPYYAVHELLAGHLRLLCDCHNVILGAANPAEALVTLASRSPFEGRKKVARIQAVANALAGAFSSHPNGPRDRMKSELLNALALKIGQLWVKASTSNKLDYVQPLACFVDGALTRGNAGELRGPSDTFNCAPSLRCAAAGYIHDDKVSLQKMIDALHPSRLGQVAAEKNENQKRRAALKELLQNGPAKFNKLRCRALGDAYFAAMCPPGSAVATSNVSDFEPLCSALGKKLVTP